jgi:hypothetical protein
MMLDGGRYRRIYSNEFHAAAFQGLTDAERVVYFYCRCGPQSTSVGIYRMSAAVAVEDLGNLTTVEFDQRFSTVCEAFGWVFDAPTRVLWMPGWIFENPPQSPNVCLSWRKLLGNLPDCELKFEAARAIFQSLKDLPKGFAEKFGSLPKDWSQTKASPKASPKPLHDVMQGIRDSGNQGSGKQRTGALRAVARKTKTNDESLVPHPDERVMRIAGELLKTTPQDATTDYLIDAVQNVCLRELKINVGRSMALVALTQSQQQGRTA